MPAWIRSSSWTLAGGLAASCSAMRRTSGACVLTVSVCSSFPWMVYMVEFSLVLAGQGRGRRCGAAGAGIRFHGPRRDTAGDAAQRDSGRRTRKGVDHAAPEHAGTLDERVRRHGGGKRCIHAEVLAAGTHTGDAGA